MRWHNARNVTTVVRAYLKNAFCKISHKLECVDAGMIFQTHFKLWLKNDLRRNNV